MCLMSTKACEYHGNAVFNLRWNHLFSQRLFSNLSLIYSDYYYGLLFDFAGFDWDSVLKPQLKYISLILQTIKQI